MTTKRNNPSITNMVALMIISKNLRSGSSLSGKSEPSAMQAKYAKIRSKHSTGYKRTEMLKNNIKTITNIVRQSVSIIRILEYKCRKIIQFMAKNINYKKILKDIKDISGMNQQQIAERIGYTRTYLSNAIKDGGSDKLDMALTKLRDDLIASQPKKITAEMALLKVLAREFALYKAQKEGVDYQEVMNDLNNKASLILDVARS